MWLEMTSMFRRKPRALGNGARLAILTMGIGAMFSPCRSAWASGPTIDYESVFAKSFPLLGDEHAITDWTLYQALVTGDVVTYALRVDPTIAAEMDGIRGRAYQTQQLETRLKQDRRLVATFDGQRKRLQSMVVTFGADAKTCPRPVAYVENEFRLVLGESSEGGDPLSHATIAPGCPPTLDAGFQVTAGRSSRFTCWTAKDSTLCGWRLPDMPVALKRVIESDYPTKMTLRWRWCGLGAAVRTRYVDAGGNRVGPRAGATLTVPLALSVEFVDGGGRVLWAATPSPASGARRHAPVASDEK